MVAGQGGQGGEYPASPHGHGPHSHIAARTASQSHAVTQARAQSRRHMDGHTQDQGQWSLVEEASAEVRLDTARRSAWL